VAVLSNSKKLFLGHLDVMFKCLRPQLSELCYIDTDSCIWSLSHSNIEDCLRPERANYWREKNIMANEAGPLSCHGKMKLEGLFDGGMFNSMKIYRLFQKRLSSETSSPSAAVVSTSEKNLDNDDDDDDDDHSFNGGGGGGEETERSISVYTRCKGINRRLAEKIENSSFNHEQRQKTVILRHCLKASRTGEISLLRESRSLAIPFNLKRFVTEDGLHTVAFSERTNNEFENE
jgi:hypothetical protein